MSVLLLIHEAPATALLMGAAAVILASATRFGVLRRIAEPWRFMLIVWAFCVVGSEAFGAFIANVNESVGPEAQLAHEAFARLGAEVGALLALVVVAAHRVRNASEKHEPPGRERDNRGRRSALKGAAVVLALSIGIMLSLGTYGSVVRGPALGDRLSSILKEALADGIWIGLVPAAIVTAVRWRSR